MYLPRIKKNIIPDHIIPNDHCKQVLAVDYIKIELNKRFGDIHILDLGCGSGDSFDLFKMDGKDVIWYGLDIADSPEVLKRIRTDANFCTYDGYNIPFPDDTFDIIFSNQVFEHIRYPEKVLSDIARVLKDSGSFFGSLSYLEPYHSYSIFNYTPYGFMYLLESAGFNVTELRPSIDSISLICYRLFIRRKIFQRFFIKESPFNLLLTIMQKVTHRSIRSANRIKLLFCGQFCFNSKLINNKK